MFDTETIARCENRLRTGWKPGLSFRVWARHQPYGVELMTAAERKRMEWLADQ